MTEAEESDVLRVIRDLREYQREKFNVTKEEFLDAVAEINKAYKPAEMTKDSKRIHLNFDSPAMRYAYLVKYPIHAAAMQYFLHQNRNEIQKALQDKGTVNICCLGGGPGTDVIAFAAEFCESFELLEKDFHFTLIDNICGWEIVFNDLFDVLDGKKHGNLGKFLKSERVSHSFICDDLSAPLEETIQAINRADVVVLMKFVSALDPKSASLILKDLYLRLNPGTLVIFLDNSGGGSKESAKDAADKCTFESVGWSTDHEVFEKRGFDEERWGVQGRNGIAIAMRMWENPQTVSPEVHN